MPSSSLPNDPLWPRAGDWIEKSASAKASLAILGVPAHRRSITPSGADATPAAVREALLRYSTFAGSAGADVSSLTAADLGDVEDPDGEGGEQRISVAAAVAAASCELLVAVGGDNSITYPLMRGLAADGLAGWGLVTIDAHHDVRDGESNGSPVRRLVEAGLPGSCIAQVGIADFSNSPAYAARAAYYGAAIIPRGALRSADLGSITAQALGAAGAGGRPVYVDIDVDVCDRSAVPGCPSAAPGGIFPDQLRQLTRLLASDPRVAAIDITEVDATADAPDGRTVRLAALLVLEAAAGLAIRERSLGA